jgi:hypothetical protein
MTRKSKFYQHDLTRALRAARAAGLQVSSVEIDAETGNIIISTGAMAAPEPKDGPAGDLERWLASPQGRPYRNSLAGRKT